MKTNAILLFFCLAAGCSSKPPRVEAPSWDPTAITENLFENDANSDGRLTREELNQAPSIQFSFDRIDTNSDGGLSAEEVEARFDMYKTRRIGLMEQGFQIIHKRRPLVGANVRLVPESFQGEILETFEGTTDFEGVVSPKSSNVDGIGMQVGFYRIEVTHNSVDIPTKFNSNTEVGVEVSPIPEGATGYGPIVVELK